MSLKKANSGGDTDREVVSTRVVNASRQQAWSVFADPKQLAQWWGPNGFTNTIQEFDLRVGGIWRMVMHGPDGTDYPNEKIFLEVSAPEWVLFRHVQPLHSITMRIIFVAQGEKTKVTWRMLFDSPEELAKVKAIIVSSNEENFDRLEAHLAKRPLS